MSFTSLPFAWQGILLTLLGALSRAFYVILNKKLLRIYSSRLIVVVNMLIASAMLWTTILIFAKPSIYNLNLRNWSSGIIWPLLITAILNIAIQFLELRALELEDASLISPISAAAPLLAVFTGIIILKELPTMFGWFGIILISVGSYILSSGKTNILPKIFKPNHLAEFLVPWQALTQSRGVKLAFLAAFAGSISINFDKIVVLASGPLFLPATVTGFVGIIMLLTLKKNYWPKKISNKDLLLVLSAPLFFSAAIVLFALGFYYGFASHSSSLRRTSILFVAILAGSMLGEKNHPERIFGAIIITIGAILLAF